MISLDLLNIPRLNSWAKSYSCHKAEAGGKTPNLPESEPTHVCRSVKLLPFREDLFGKPS